MPSRFLLLTLCLAAAALRAAEAPPALPKPFIIVEAWHDREYCSDLYAYDFEGRLLRRLTQKPLPSCSLQAVAGDGGQVTFVANASALYNLNMRWESLVALHGGDADAVAMPADGKGVAYVARGFQKDAGQFLYVQPLVAGAPFKKIELPLKETPAEMVFAPDGKRLLLTIWTGGRARIDSGDLESRKIAGWMSDGRVSYCQPTFAPDGRSVAAIGENLETGEWTIVSKAWPEGEIRVLRAGPRGVPLGLPIFTADGQYLLFWQSGIWARMPAGGGGAEGLSGDLDDRPRAPIPRGLMDRPRPMRGGSLPLSVGRWFAYIEHEQPDGKLVLIEVRTKEKKTVPLPKGKVVRAVVVE